MPLTHDIGVRIPYPLLKTDNFGCLFFLFICLFNAKPTRTDHFEQVSDHCIIPGKEMAIAFAMWQWGEAWELAHRSLTLLTHYHAVVHLCTPTTNAQNKKKG